MAEPNNIEVFKAVVNGNLPYLQSLSSDVDLNQYFTFDIYGPMRICMCHIKFERFVGSAESMLSEFEDVIKSGFCNHCEGRPLYPEDESVRSSMADNVLDEHQFEIDQFVTLSNESLATERKCGVNALHIATVLNYSDVVLWLLNKGLNIHSPTIWLTDPAINLAVLSGHKEMVCTLMTNGCNPDIKGERTMDNPVFLAVEESNVEMLELLIEHHVNLNHQCSYGQTAIQLAVTERRRSCVQALVKAGVDTSTNASLPNLEDTLLCHAIKTSEEIAKILINGNADLNERGKGVYNRPPIFVAIHQGKLELLKLLLEKGVDCNSLMDDDHSALHLAGFVNSLGAVKVLLQFGVDKDGITKHKYSTLHHTAWDGRVEICKILLDAGAVYDNQTEDKNTPLALACHGNHIDVIKLFLSQRVCNVNNQDKDQDTPLHYTTFSGNLEASMLLLAHGANPSSENSANCTPLWNAIYSQNIKLVRLLLEYNVPVNVCSRGIDQHGRSNDVTYVYPSKKSLLYVSCDRGLKGVPLLLVLAGLDLSKEKWIFNRKFPSSLNVQDEDEENSLIGELNRLTRNALTLKEISRIVVRKFLGLKLANVVDHLELPFMLNKYLILKDL